MAPSPRAAKIAAITRNRCAWARTQRAARAIQQRMSLLGRIVTAARARSVIISGMIVIAKMRRWVGGIGVRGGIRVGIE